MYLSDIIGALYRSGLMDCPECKGRKTMQYANWPKGMFDTTLPMDTVSPHTEVTVTTEPCRRCRGSGRL